MIDIKQAGARYREYPVSDLSYATVKDYCDSADNLEPLAKAVGDLKDVQRPWMLKAILGTVRPGSRLLEIGAGEPVIADLLERAGYAVTIVDPYDGSGNGPIQYQAYRSGYPRLRFVRDVFTEGLGIIQEGFDCVYSISVLEHVPMELVSSLCRGIRAALRPGGKTIHAIDHVLLGAGDEFHLRKLMLYADELGADRERLVHLLRQASVDAETYFLSAESHNRWRGAIPYEEFPMRKVISVQMLLDM